MSIRQHELGRAPLILSDEDGVAMPPRASYVIVMLSPVYLPIIDDY